MLSLSHKPNENKEINTINYQSALVTTCTLWKLVISHLWYHFWCFVDVEWIRNRRKLKKNKNNPTSWMHNKKLVHDGNHFLLYYSSSLETRPQLHGFHIKWKAKADDGNCVCVCAIAPASKCQYRNTGRWEWACVCVCVWKKGGWSCTHTWHTPSQAKRSDPLCCNWLLDRRCDFWLDARRAL